MGPPDRGGHGHRELRENLSEEEPQRRVLPTGEETERTLTPARRRYLPQRRGPPDRGGHQRLAGRTTQHHQASTKGPPDRGGHELRDKYAEYVDRLNEGSSRQGRTLAHGQRVVETTLAASTKGPPDRGGHPDVEEAPGGVVEPASTKGPPDRGGHRCGQPVPAWLRGLNEGSSRQGRTPGADPAPDGSPGSLNEGSSRQGRTRRLGSVAQHRHGASTKGPPDRGGHPSRRWRRRRA